MKLLANPPAYYGHERQFSLFDDFLWFISPHLWTLTTADAGGGAGAAIDADGVGGRLVLTTGGTDNNEIYVHTTNELFLFAANKPLRAGVLLQFAEANTDDANVIFGFANAVAANHLQDNGAGPVADFDGAVFYKVDGGTKWNVRTSNGTANSSDETDVTAGGAAFQKLEIVCQPYSSTEMEVTFLINDQQCRSSSATAGQPNIRHKYTLASSTEMMLFVGAKAGGANSEVVVVDWIGADQLR